MQPTPHAGGQINNNMTMAIVSIFFFWPLAIPAIMNASKVRTLEAQGDIAGAQAAAESARKFAKLGIIIGAVVLVLVCGFVACTTVLAGTAGTAGTGY